MREVQRLEREKIEAGIKETKIQFANFLAGRELNNLDLVRQNSPTVIELSFQYLEKNSGIKQNLVKYARQDSIYYTLLRSQDDRPDREGSFHRGKRSLFMDFGNLSKNDWFVTFIHELAHGVDSVMREAVVLFGRISTRQQVQAIVDTKSSVQDLNPQEKLVLKNWIIAGLNRGLLAEYRAWLLTFYAYQEGLTDGSLTKVAWLEKIHNTKPANQSIETHIYRFLSETWTNPKTEIFAKPLMQELLTEIRNEYYQNPELIELGSIGQIIHP